MAGFLNRRSLGGYGSAPASPPRAAGEGPSPMARGGGPPRRRLPGPAGGTPGLGGGGPQPSAAGAIPSVNPLTGAPDATLNPENVGAYLGMEQPSEEGIDRFLQMLFGRRP